MQRPDALVRGQPTLLTFGRIGLFGGGPAWRSRRDALCRDHVLVRRLRHAQVRRVKGEDGFQNLGHVLHQMEAVGDLHGLRRSATRSLRIGPGTVPRDDLNPGMIAQPPRQGVRLAVGQEGDPPPLLQVNQHGAVGMTLAQRPVIDPKNRRDRAGWHRRGTDQAQQGIARLWHPKVPAEPGAGGTAQRHGDCGELFVKPQRFTRPRYDDVRQALGEDPAWAASVVAEQLAHTQDQADAPTSPGESGKGPLVMAVDAARRPGAQRAERRRLL